MFAANCGVWIGMSWRSPDEVVAPGKPIVAGFDASPGDDNVGFG